jgi:hypothetical protein
VPECQKMASDVKTAPLTLVDARCGKGTNGQTRDEAYRGMEELVAGATWYGQARRRQKPIDGQAVTHRAAAKEKRV